jgi:hypothetical protein
MSIEIHPDAKANYDRKALSLITLVREVPLREAPTTFQPDLHVSHNIDLKESLGEPKFGRVNHLGQEVERSFFYDDKLYGFTGDEYLEYSALAVNIQKSSSIRNILSLDFVKDDLFSWIQISLKEHSQTSFIDHLIHNGNAAVKKHTIWIPIPYTSTQASFTIGNISYEIMSRELLDQWFTYGKQAAHSPEEEKGIEDYKHKLRKDCQGYAAGVYICTAEPIRAQELAYLHLNNSLSILRLFCPANHIPGIISGAYEYGRNMIRSKQYFIEDREDQFFIDNSELLDRGLIWNIDSRDIAAFNTNEFKKYNELLCAENPNEYQAKLLEALLIYSRNTLMRDLYDKILYILVALESILLRNDNEPIQQNVGDRIAFAIGKDPIERRKIVQTFKEIYAIRSRYIHHGTRLNDNNSLIQQFMQYAFITFDSLVRNIHQFKTKEECINALEHVKYS